MALTFCRTVKAQVEGEIWVRKVMSQAPTVLTGAHSCVFIGVTDQH